MKKDNRCRECSIILSDAAATHCLNCQSIMASHGGAMPGEHTGLSQTERRELLKERHRLMHSIGILTANGESPNDMPSRLTVSAGWWG